MLSFRTGDKLVEIRPKSIKRQKLLPLPTANRPFEPTFDATQSSSDDEDDSGVTPAVASFRKGLRFLNNNNDIIVSACSKRNAA
jgi:hypothetical protein